MPLNSSFRYPKMRIWLIVRWAIVLAAAVSEFFAPLHPLARPPIGWGALLAIFGACCVGMVFVLGLQVVNPFSGKPWLRPSWYLNPFNFCQPIQFFHLGAYVCFAQAVVLLARLVASQVSFYIESLVPLAIGLGIFLGLQLVMLVFGARFE